MTRRNEQPILDLVTDAVVVSHLDRRVMSWAGTLARS